MPKDGIIAKYDRTGGEAVQARIDPYKGRDYFSIRTWYQKDGTGDMLPGRNGINLPVDEASDFLKLVVALFPDQVKLVEKEGD
jgi:hypothetical protein